MEVGGVMSTVVYSFGNSLVSSQAKDLLGYAYTPFDPLNPLHLPPYTIRVKCMPGNTPGVTKGTTTYVGDDVYDITYESRDWYALFYGNYRITKVLGANTSGVTEMSDMFESCTNLSRVEHPFNCGDALQAYDMFRNCTNLQYAPDLNLSRCTRLSGLFYNCTALSSVGNIDMSSAYEAGNMFNGCQSLHSIPQLDTSNVQDFIGFFANCTGVSTFPAVDTHNATRTSGMFSSCLSLTMPPMLDTSNVEDMSGMFAGCSNLQSIPQYDTSNATNMSDMFKYCPSLNVANMPALDTSSAESMSAMFWGTPVGTVPAWLNTRNVQDFYCMFYDSSLRTLSNTPLRFDSAVNVESMFEGNYYVTDGAYAMYQTMSQIPTITNHSRCFNSCGRSTSTGEAELNMIPESWGGNAT
jgi:surface protein